MSLALAPRIGAIARPVAAVGAVTRLGASLVFQRGSAGWAFVMTRSRIDYRYEVGDPARNSIVGAVVGWISRNFPDAPVRVVREDDPLRTPIPRSASGVGAMLQLLENPNPYYSGVLQWRATVADFVVNDDAYWVKVRNDADRVVALWWVPSTMLEPRWPDDDPTVFIGWYEYTVDGRKYRIEPRNVVHFRNGINPENPRKGRGELGTVLREIFTDEEGSNFTASLLRNLGVPGVVLAPANTTGRMGLEADPESVKTSFMDKFGGDKRGEPLVLTAPTDVKVLSWSPEQMNLRELRRIPEERVSAVTGVPAGVAGLGAGLDRNTFTNYGEAKKAAYTEGVAPLQRLMAAELERQLLPDFGADPLVHDVYFDTSVVPAMQEAAGEVEKRDQAAATKGLMTRSAYLIRRGQTPAPDGSDDVYIIPNNFVVLAAPAPGRAEAKEPTVLLGGKPDVPQLGPGPGGDTEAAPIAAVTAEVRCPKDGALLAELATEPYRFTCRKCSTVVAAGVDG